MTREEYWDRFNIIHKAALECYEKNSGDRYTDFFEYGAEWADNNPIIKDNEYIALGWPQVQKYMKDHYEDIGYDSRMNLWFVPKKKYIYESK